MMLIFLWVMGLEPFPLLDVAADQVKFKQSEGFLQRVPDTSAELPKNNKAGLARALGSLVW